jgi:hypothetical protein
MTLCLQYVCVLLPEYIKENNLFSRMNLDSKLSVVNICIACYDIPKLIINT